VLGFGEIGVRGEGFGLSHGWGWGSLNWWGKVRECAELGFGVR
jgi:hypothetical protein